MNWSELPVEQKSEKVC